MAQAKVDAVELAEEVELFDALVVQETLTNDVNPWAVQ